MSHSDLLMFKNDRRAASHSQQPESSRDASEAVVPGAFRWLGSELWTFLDRLQLVLVSLNYSQDINHPDGKEKTAVWSSRMLRLSRSAQRINKRTIYDALICLSH